MLRAHNAWIYGGLLATIGCSTPGKAPGPVIVDTLANRTVRVRSSRPTGWTDPNQGWKVEEVAQYGDAEGGPGALVDPTQVAQDAQGRVYLADSRPASIKMFARDGRFIRTIGREGKGPGEYTAPFIAITGRLLVVHDPDQRRTSVFDTAGSYLRSWRSTCCFWTPIGIDSAARIYLSAPNPLATDDAPSPRLFVRFDTLGGVIDTLAVPPGPKQKEWQVTTGKAGNQVSVGTVIPFAPQVRIDFHPAGGFVYGLADRYQFVVSRTGADTVQLIERTWTPEPIPEPVRHAAVARVKRWMSKSVDPGTLDAAILVSDVPTTAPAFTGLYVGADGFIWATRLDADSTRTRLDVFRPDGAWLGPLTLPYPIGQAYAFGNGEILLGGEADDGRPIVRRLTVRR